MQDLADYRLRPKLITGGSLIGLAMGFGLGLLAYESQASWLLTLAAFFKPVGMLWTNALRMIVLPLMISYLVLAIASVTHTRATGKAGGLSLLLFLLFLCLAGAFTLIVSPWLLTGLTIDAETRVALQSMSAAGPGTVGRAAQTLSFSEWITTLIPTNLFRALVEENIQALVICTILFSLAITRIGPERRKLLIRFFEAIAETTKVLIGWVLLVIPVGVFALTFSIAATTGGIVAGSIGYFILLISALLLAFTMILYPITMIFGRVSLRRFGAGVAPAQAVAVGTRSSLASLPALIQGAQQRLRLPSEVAGFVLPLSVSTFKVDLAITGPLQLLFLTRLYGLPLTPGYAVTFTLTYMLLSLTSAGIPSGGGSLVSIPLYMGAGIPAEAIILLKAVDAIPDIFKTLVNVTADMSVAVIVARFVALPAHSPNSGGYDASDAGAIVVASDRSDAKV